MRLQEVLDLAPSVDGASFSLVADDHLRIVRAADGVEVAVRLHTASSFPNYQREGDSIVAVRWVNPAALEPSTLDELHAKASISVASVHRYENLYGKSNRTYFRAQLLATGLSAPRFLAALAQDLGLHTSLAAPSPAHIEDVRRLLEVNPVKSPEQALLDAILGGSTTRAGELYRVDGGELDGPSSLGMEESSTRSKSVAIRIRICNLGLVHVRHVRAAPAGVDVTQMLDAINSENSSDETCVTYHRAFRTPDEQVALEFSASVEEIESELFTRKMHALERTAQVYWRDRTRSRGSE